MPLPTGKLHPDLLSRLLSGCEHSSERVIVGPAVGEDAAVIDFGDTCLVAKTDPITFVTDQVGIYAIVINANDIAVMGATPKWFLATLLLPEAKTDQNLIESIFHSINSAASEFKISVCGGHTEITHGLDRPIVVGHMLGEVKKEDLVLSSGLQVGDSILLTKGMGIEATAIIAREKGVELEGVFGHDFLSRCKDYLKDPGLSVLVEARIACGAANIHAMHDPTEGGVASGLHELARASKVGIEVMEDRLFMAKESRVLCDALSLDPLGVISSGALLIGVSDTEADAVIGAIRNSSIRCDRIATVRERGFGIKIGDGGHLADLPAFPQDEITKVF